VAEASQAGAYNLPRPHFVTLMVLSGLPAGMSQLERRRNLIEKRMFETE
jgi:hypothetical protein